MGINFNKLAGNLNPQTQFISDGLDTVDKGCCFCGTPEGEGSFDRLDVAIAIQTNITGRIAELQTMSREDIVKIKANVEAMANKFSGIGAWFRSDKDRACGDAFRAAVETISAVIAANADAQKSASKRNIRGAVMLPSEVGEAHFGLGGAAAPPIRLPAGHGAVINVRPAGPAAIQIAPVPTGAANGNGHSAAASSLKQGSGSAAPALDAAVAFSHGNGFGSPPAVSPSNGAAGAAAPSAKYKSASVAPALVLDAALMVSHGNGFGSPPAAASGAKYKSPRVAPDPDAIRVATYRNSDSPSASVSRSKELRRALEPLA